MENNVGNVLDKSIEAIVSVRRIVAVPVAAKIDCDRPVSPLQGHLLCGLFPGMSGLPAAVYEQDWDPGRRSPCLARDRYPCGRFEALRR
jgi:hypothetical protein